MRVTNSSTYRNFTSSINEAHSMLNKSMEKVSSGKAYESAADNPLAYYQGQKIDSQYQDVLSKISLIGDVKDRLYQQELGARSIQKTLSDAKNKIQYIRTDSNNGEMGTVDTVREDLLQKQQSMVNDLNSQYQNYYVFGGNDGSTPPFSLSSDGTTLTFSHKFAGDTAPTEMVMTLTKQTDGSYKYVYGDPAVTDPNDPKSSAGTLNNILKAMKEQSRVDIGYGNISDKSTLLDTYTGGLNLLTGLTSDSLNSMTDAQAIAEIQDRMNKSPIGLIGQAASALSDFSAGGSKDEFSSSLGTIMDNMTDTEHYVSTVYSDLGNKASLLDKTGERLDDMKMTLTIQYKNKLGADPYKSIMEMNSYQFSYNAAQQVGSHLMQSSLFDFMR